MSPSVLLGPDASGPEFEAIWQALLAALETDPPDLARFDAIGLHLPWTVTLKDADGRLQTANPPVYSLSQLAAEAMLGRSYEELAVDHPHLALQSPSVRAADEAAWEVRHRISFLRNQLSREGHLLTLRVHKQGVRDASGARRFMLSMAGFVESPNTTESQQIMAEHLYRLLADHSSDLVCLLELDGRCRYASPSLQRLLGDPPASWIGRPLADHADPDDVPALAAWQRRAPDRDAPEPLRHALQGDSGQRRLFDSRLTPLREDAGRPDRITGLVFSARDVTESQQALDALQSVDRRLALGLHMTRVGVYDIDLPRGVAWFSPEFERLLGYPVGEFAHTWDRWDLHLHPDDLERGERERRALLKGESDTWDFDIRHRRAAGDYLWMRSRGQVLDRGADGRVHRLIGTLQDIDERVQQTEALRRTRQRLELALEVSGTGIAEFDPASGRVRADPTLSRMQGFGPGAHEGPIEDFVARVDPMDATVAQGLLARVLQGQNLPITALRVRRADDDRQRWLELSAGVLQESGGTRIVCAAWDTTERRAAEEQLRATGERGAFLLHLGDAFQPLEDPLAVVEVATRLLGQHLQADRAGMSRVEGDSAVVAGEWSAPGVPSLPRQIRVSSFGDDVATAHRRGDTVVCADVATDPRLDVPARAAHTAASIAAFVRVMLRQSGRWVAAFGVHSSTPRAWTEAEVALVQEVAERTWSYSEQVRAQAALRDSEAHYRSLFEAMSEGFTVGELVRAADGVAVDLRYVDLNRAFESLTGLKRDQCLGRLVSEVIPGLDPAWYTVTQRAVDTGVPQRVEAYVPTLGRWYEATSFAWGAERFGMVYNDITQRKQAEAALRGAASRQAFLVQLADRMRPMADAQALLNAGAAMLGGHLDATRVLWFNLEGDDAVIGASWTLDAPPPRRRVPLAAFGHEIVAAYRHGQLLAIDDVAADPRIDPMTLEEYRAARIGALAGLMLLRDGRWVAVLEVQQATPRRWTPEETELIRDVAERLWVAAERAHAEAALQANAQRQGFLVRLGDALRAIADPVLLQQEAARLLADHLGANRVAWSELDGDEAVVTATHSRGVPALPPRMALSGFGEGILAAYRAGESVAVGDVFVEPRIDRVSRAAYRADGIAAFAGQMLMRDGRWVAVFEVHQSTPRRWTPGEVDLVREVGERIWAAAQRARAEAAVRESEARQQFLLALSDALAPVRDPRAVQAIAARLLGERLQAQRTCYFGVDGHEYRVEADYTRGVPSVVGRHSIAALGIMGGGIGPGDVVVVDDVWAWPGLTEEHRHAYAAVQIAAFIGVPLVKEGQLIAGLAVHSSTPRRWSATEVGLAREVAERTWSAVERSRAEHSLAEAQDRLRDLAARLDVERDQERQRIALDVHDELGQQLTAIKLQLGLLEARLGDPVRGDPAALRESVLRTHELVDTTIEITRDIAARLRQPGEGLGLASGIASLAEEFALRTEVACELRCRVDRDAVAGLPAAPDGTELETDPERIDAAMPEAVAGPLLRVVQESLTNVTRHAQARRVTIDLVLTRDRLKVDIGDDGRGFDPVKVPPGRLGLVGMRERTARIGATLDWRRNDPCGTIVRIRWPRADQESP